MDGRSDFFYFMGRVSRALIRRTKKFCPRSEIAVMRPEGGKEEGNFPKVDNGPMNVNKLNKEVLDRQLARVRVGPSLTTER